MTDEQTGAAEAQAPVPPSPPTPTPTPNRTSALVPVQTPERGLVPIPEPGPAATITLEPVTASADADRATSGDPFPREAWTTLASHAAGYLRLTVALLRDPSVSRHRRAALLAAAAYFASPIDLIPGIVPVLGQVDDLAVAMLAIRLALNALEPSRRQMHLAAAGLSDETLHEDLVATGRLAAWTARAGARTGLRIGRGALRVTVRTGRDAVDLAARGGRAAVRRAGPVVERSSGAAARAAGRTTSAGRGLADRIRRRGPGTLSEPLPGEPSDPLA
jgi:uncharacterized membrane protein YkvA (DUF1232 family)